MKYFYVIDLNERGYFNAHVEDECGTDVYTITNEREDEDYNIVYDVLELVEDGFMENWDDVSGLEAYLIQMEVLDEDDTLEIRR